MKTDGNINETTGSVEEKEKDRHLNLEEKFERWLVRFPKIHELYVEYEEIITYLVVGGMTTVVSWTCKFLANALLYHGAVEHNTVQTLILSIINWTSGVIFAFFTNRAYVFKSKGPMLPEAGKFVLSRASTLVLDYVVMMVLDTWLGINFYVATIISAVLVIVANYILSKLLVFKKSE